MAWRGLGFNYKLRIDESASTIDEDIAYFKSIGIRYIRPHIPGYNASDLSQWRLTAKYFHDRGFWVQWGVTTSGVIHSRNVGDYLAAVEAEAAYSQFNNLCDEFGIGNEHELHNHWRLSNGSGSSGGATAVRASNVVTVTTNTAHSYQTGDLITVIDSTGNNVTDVSITVTGTTTFTYSHTGSDQTFPDGRISNYKWTTLRNDLRTVATNCQSLFTGPISYQTEPGTVGSGHGSKMWESEGKGNIDWISINTYGIWTNNRYINRNNYQTYLPSFISTFGSSAYISEFNLDANNTNFQAVPAEVGRVEMLTMQAYIQSLGYTRAQLYQYRGYRGSDSDFNIRYSNGDFRDMWNPLFSNGKRSFYVNV